MKKPLRSILLISALLLNAGCASAPVPYALSYHQALQASQPGKTSAGIDAFAELYGDLQGPALAERIRSVYAPALYFNDTVHTFDKRDDLIAYLEKTARRAELIEVRIDDVVTSGSDAYIRWTMRTVFRVAGSEKDVLTVGMTHLRFDDQGRVILHQDFWDSAEGIYRHLPVVGTLVNWIGGNL